MSDRPTLVRPPPPDSTKAPIENVLEVTKLDVLGPDIFTNTRQPWHPPGARGIFGGAVIAQCLAAGQKTVPANFFPHSCHCYFLLAGSDEIPILFHVERVRDGRSFCTRTVQARQRGRCIFTVTMSFVKAGSGGARQVSHQAEFPTEEVPPTDQEITEEESRMGGIMSGGPFQNWRVNLVGKGGHQATINADSQRNGQRPETLKTRMWVRARGKISEEGGHEAHLNALAYVSDSYFIGTASRVHGLWRWPFKPDEVEGLPEKLRAQVKRQVEFEGTKWDVEELTRRERLGMMVSLDHSIYFHHPDKVRADDWMLCEMESPWAGDGRGVVTQRIFSRDGTLLATCVQEGLVRLKQDGEDQPKEAGKAKAKAKI